MLFGDARRAYPESVPRPPRFLAAVIAVPLIAVALLSGCAASSGGSPDEDRAALASWGDDLISASSGGMGGTMVADASGPGTPFDLDTPTRYSAVELRCKGTDSARFTLRYTGTEDAVTATQDIVCHDGGMLTPIAIPTSLGELTAFEASVTSPDGEGYWVAIPQK